MSARAATRGLTAIGLLLGLTAGKPATDVIWVHPEIQRHRVREVAMLPISTIDGDYRKQVAVEEAWMRRFFDSHHFWLPPSLTRLKAGATSRQRDSIEKVVLRQIRREGSVGMATARDLCRSMRVSAVLCLRIDRWELVWFAGGPEAVVDLSAALVDSSGNLVWKASGQGRHTRGTTSRAVSAGEMATGATAGRADVAAELAQALDVVMSRWAGTFPPPSSLRPIAQTGR